MLNHIKVAEVSELPPGHRILCEAGGRRIAVFNLDGTLRAIGNQCPHRGGPVGSGLLEGQTITCPWHGLRFDVADGKCLDTGDSLKCYDVHIQDNDVLVDVSPLPEQEDGITRYLVRHGIVGHVGRFGSIEPIECSRGDRVVVMTDRGVELGEVLSGGHDEAGATQNAPAGEMLRLMNDDDSRRESKLGADIDDIMKSCQQLLSEEGIPVTVVDGERLFDGQTIVLYFLGHATERLGPVSVRLSDLAAGARVQFEPIEELTETTTLKGPYERSKYDFRRVWECPACHHRERSTGDITAMICKCQKDVTMTQQVCMKLVDDAPRRI